MRSKTGHKSTPDSQSETETNRHDLGILGRHMSGNSKLASLISNCTHTEPKFLTTYTKFGHTALQLIPSVYTTITEYL